MLHCDVSSFSAAVASVNRGDYCIVQGCMAMSSMLWRSAWLSTASMCTRCDPDHPDRPDGRREGEV